MGCDIHLYVEVKKNGKWKSADEWKKDEDGYVSTVDPIYRGRNYDLFAVLANVRNGYGFAGRPTGEGFNPISHPKGTPKDVSDEVRSKIEDMDSDGHSHSWLTVKELLDFDWAQKTMAYGSSDTYAAHCGKFFTESIPKLQSLGDPEDVRIVFFFDN